MGRDRKSGKFGEAKIIRTISVTPSIWYTFKDWCRGEGISMSEAIEDTVIRLMDMDSDPLALEKEIDGLSAKLKRAEYKFEGARIERDSLQTKLTSAESRMSDVIRQLQDEELKAERRAERMEKYQKSYSKLFANFTFQPSPPSVKEVRRRTTILDNVSELEAREIIQAVFGRR